MIDTNNAHLWEIWDYPDDEDWDGETFDIGYSTESGTGTFIATGLRKEDAEFIVKAARFYDQYLVARRLDKR
jgi:hypothetical protein